MDVKKIPVGVQCLLSASAKIHNYKRAVEEMVHNSLDAESTCIAIRIHIQNNWVQVVDNGIGIKEADYKLLGERYATSKLHDINTLRAVPVNYGYQGQALANIIEVSQIVKITSRFANSDDTWVKTFHEGKVEQECIKAPMRPSKGTTIEINGFLYNLKIRKRFINTFNELQDIKRFLEQLLLIFNNVSISLRDDSENEIIFKMHKNRDIYQTLKSVFDIDINDVQELQVEKNEYKVKAFIGVENRGMKNVHWIYLNNKFVDISDLHRKINDKFKSNIVKHRKIKTRGAYEHYEENSAACESVPFYFLFITCPYSEYDIFNYGKQISIVFKDWMQINKLIEKLIKFYNGDIKLLNIRKNDNKKKVEDTRDEVKKIMEKILGRPNKLARISQMPNGVKGKQVTRKRKTQPMNLSLTKIIPPKNNAHENLENIVKVKLSKNKIIKVPISTSNIQKLPKPIGKNSKPKNNANKKIHNRSKTSLKCKCNKNCVNIVDIFKNDTHSSKRRCSDLSYNLLNTKIRENIKNIFINQMKNKRRITELKQGEGIVNELLINNNTKATDVVKLTHIRNNKKPMAEGIRSYDLLQTIIKTQQDLYDQESRREDTFMDINRSNIQRSPAAKSNYYGPKLTFESHKYKSYGTFNRNKLPQKVKFISKQSRDNFNMGADKYNPNIDFKTKKITKRHDFFSTTYKKKRNFDKCKRLLDKYEKNTLENPFSVDVSETDIVEFSKQIRKQVTNDMNLLFDNGQCNNTNSSKTQCKFGVNLNIERTYTIIVDSFCNASQALNIHKNHDSSYHDGNHSDHANKISNIILTSAQPIPKENFDNPLDVCEAILNDPNNTEDDLNNSFNIIPTQVSSLIIKEHRNMNGLLNENNTIKSQINNSTNKTSRREDCAAVIPTKENKEKYGSVKANYELPDEIKYRNENETDMIQDNSIYNFKLNTRHRFVPKGMSQIFKNCFSKNICSYNLNTEYYENTIYDNFAEDVAVNTEIFEAKVENLKEFTTGDIQKVTERLKKHNADLIFGTDSLRKAKVLGQVDCKFIAATIKGLLQSHNSPEFLVLFDQHAVHERIRLEENLSYYFYENKWKKVAIDTISLKTSKDEILYLHNHKDKFIRFGLEWTVLNYSEILVNAIPEAIRGKNARPMEIIVKAVRDLILEQIHAIKYLKGNVSLYPQSIMNLVFSEACRYAIKFGDILSTRDCVELINALSYCRTPFQCAHGRPVMAVMLELENVQFQYQTNMENIRQFMSCIKK